MEDKDIIMLYEKGYSIDYIANRFYKFKNRKQKPVIVDGVVLFPAKIYKKSDCRLYVCSVIYDNMVSQYKEKTIQVTQPTLPF